MSLVKQALVIEIRQHIAKAMDLKKKIDTAKTETKKSVYNKKLKKNNIEAADLLVALDRLLLEETKNKQADDGVKDEVPVLEGRTQEADGDKSPLE